MRLAVLATTRRVELHLVHRVAAEVVVRDAVDFHLQGLVDQQGDRTLVADLMSPVCEVVAVVVVRIRLAKALFPPLLARGRARGAVPKTGSRSTVGALLPSFSSISSSSPWSLSWLRAIPFVSCRASAHASA